MKPEQFSSTALYSDSVSLLKRVCLLGGAGLLSGSVVLVALPARANSEVESEVPTSVEAVPEIAPVETSAESLLKPHVTANPAVEAAPVTPQPSTHGVSPEALLKPHVTANPEVEVAPATPTVEIVTPEVPGDYADAPDVDGVLIDPTDYSLGATASPSGPAVIFSNRSTGCQLTLDQGQSIPNQTCASSQSAPAIANWEAEQDGAASGGGISVGPVSINGNGITVGGTTVISREYFNERVRPLNLLRRGAEEFVFPLATPAPITSLFGWRNHPIFHERRFHSGTDLGAPTGTPVLAVKDGEVSVAEYLGGYGYTVILRHEEGTQETRYAHLSQILVDPGEQIKQGEVVGLVGSTGNSTGPHLHFELRELTAQGWVLIDPDELMSLTVASLVDALNNPLQALGITDEDAKAEKSVKEMSLPYRPAQPNAS
ncbi:MAG: peptidoglycan DD-metalloendopeptidase family protein [Cyanobacteria bacterium P01_F01_bin.86]